MTFSIKLTGYTGGTLDLTGNNPYYMNAPGWRPSVARIQDQGMGGHPYDDVTETIPLMIVSDTEANALDALEDLVSAMSQSVRWSRGENVPAVLVEIERVGSGLPYKAAVLGPGGDRHWMQLSPTFRRDIGAYVISPIDLSFRRRGAWLGAEETITLGNTFEAGELATHNFSTGGALKLPSPMLYRVTNIPTITAGAERLPRGIIVFNAHDYILIVEAESEAAGGWTTVNESANFARGGSVSRSTSATPQILLNPAGITGSTGLSISGAYTIFAVMRSSASDTTWGIQTFLAPSSGGSNSDAGKTRQLVFGSTKPTAVCLGTMRSPVNETDGFLINFERLTGSGTLDIDYFVITDPTRPEFGIIQLTLDDINVSSVSRITIDHSLLTKPSPRVFMGFNTSDINLGPLPYRGLPVLASQSQELDVVMMLTGEDNSGAYWRYMQNSALYTTLGLSATRRPAYLVPR